MWVSPTGTFQNHQNWPTFHDLSETRFRLYQRRFVQPEQPRSARYSSSTWKEHICPSVVLEFYRNFLKICASFSKTMRNLRNSTKRSRICKISSNVHESKLFFRQSFAEFSGMTLLIILVARLPYSQEFRKICCWNWNSATRYGEIAPEFLI